MILILPIPAKVKVLIGFLIIIGIIYIDTRITKWVNKP